jgi:serine/threonine protein kinase
MICQEKLVIVSYTQQSGNNKPTTIYSGIGMTMILSGYQIGEQVYAGTRTLVYRGVRQQDQKPVVIKLLRRDYPSVSELVQFRNQYTITKNLDNEGIVRTYSLENYQNSYALVMEDFGGISLKEYTSATPISLADFFPIALQIVTILNDLYHHRIIHKDIKPANILINRTTKQVKLIDFSIASLLQEKHKLLVALTF